MRKLGVTSITVVACAVIFLMFQHWEFFAGSSISFFSDPLLGEHIAVRSIPTDIISALMALLGFIFLGKLIRRRLADRKKGPQRVARGGRAKEE